MSENTVTPEAAPAPAQPAQAVARVAQTEHYDPNEPSSLYLNTGFFEQAQRAALMLSKSGAIPAHLQENVPDCFLVIEQACRWRMSPYAVAQSCYVLQGRLGYEGKLVAAVVNASPNLKSKLNYEYSGTGLQRQIRVFGTLKGETQPREVVGTVEAWRTTNKQWSTQTDQMLAYRGAREWARRHMPETLLGVYAEEELPEVVRSETVTVTPASLDDLTGEVVSAKDDPKVVDALVVEPKREAKKAAPKAKATEPPPTPPAAPMDADDQAIAALFDKP